MKQKSLQSLDTPAIRGDHENYFAKYNDINKYSIKHRNGSVLDTGFDCEAIAVLIRAKTDEDYSGDYSGRMWPNILKTTLVFSRIKYIFENELDRIGDIDCYDFQKAIKPSYG